MIGTYTNRMTAVALAASVVCGFAVTPTQARDYHSYAFVNEDATLRISGRHIRLYGVHIPGRGPHCGTSSRNRKCSKRAALALESKIQGFVRCRVLKSHKDRSVTAQCFNQDEDLSAYLLERGLAVALPGAPIEYTTLERIAERRGVGVWSAQVERRPNTR